MIKACKLEFRANKETIPRLFECNRISAKIWNDTLVLAREFHKENNKWIGKKQLHQATKGKYPIHSQAIRQYTKNT